MQDIKPRSKITILEVIIHTPKQSRNSKHNNASRTKIYSAV